MSDLTGIRLNLLTLAEAAEALHVSRYTLDRLIRAGHLATFQHPGVKRTYITPEAITDYAARCK